MEVSFCQTISFNADTFEYESVTQENGNATIIRFPIDEKLYSPGDVVVVVAGEDMALSARSRMDTLTRRTHAVRCCRPGFSDVSNCKSEI